jgi:hypothetical protein
MPSPCSVSGTRRATPALLAMFCIAAVFSPMLSGQSVPVYGRTRAIDESHSQSERQAEQTVSLSAEKLIALMQKETGLLLEVKKLLVRKAFEQGRILESKDLTDEALFRMLREDENIRVLATQEVSNRLYIRALPNQDERQREGEVSGRPSATNVEEESSAPANPAKTRSMSQEDRYWSEQDRRSPASPQPSLPQYKLPPEVQQPPETDNRRAVEQAQMQDSDDFDGMPTGLGGTGSGVGGSGSFGSMERISPEELPGLIRARTEQSTTPGSIGSGGNSMNQQMVPNMGRLPMDPASAQPSGDYSGGRAAISEDRNSLSRRASLDPSHERVSSPLFREDHAPLRHRVNPYADVPSLYDLYSQYGRRSPALVRFGDDVFRNGTGNFDQLPMDLPVGPDYVLGPGDSVSINLWGGVSQRLRRVVDGEGRIALPEAGFVQVS